MRLLIYGFNEACLDIAASYLKFEDESTNVIQFCTTSKGGLPQLYYIFRKQEMFGTDFKMVACSVTGELILLDIQQRK